MSRPVIQMEGLFSIPQLAKRWDVSEAHARRMCDAVSVAPSKLVGHSRLYTEIQADEILSAYQSGTRPKADERDEALTLAKLREWNNRAWDLKILHLNSENVRLRKMDIESSTIRRTEYGN